MEQKPNDNANVPSHHEHNDEQVAATEESAYIKEVQPESAATTERAANETTERAASETTERGANKTQEHMQQAKALSKQYVKFSLHVLQRPFERMHDADAQHFPNALITLGLAAVLFPIFVATSAARMGLGFSFGSMIMQPLLYAVLGMAAAIGAIYGILKLQGVQVEIKQITVQYAVLLVTVPASLLLTIVLALLAFSVQLTLFFFVLSVLFAIVAMNVVVLQYSPDNTPKLDRFYSLVIANMIVGYFFYKLALSAASAFLFHALNMFFPF